MEEDQALRNFHRDRACCWHACGFSDAGQHEYLSRDQPSAAFSPLLALPRGLDDPLCPDGHQRGNDLYRHEFNSRRTGTRAGNIRRELTCEFRLELDLFQSPRIFPCVSLAFGIALPHRQDDPAILQNQAARRVSANPIRRLGDVCGILKRCHLAAEQIKERLISIYKQKEPQS